MDKTLIKEKLGGRPIVLVGMMGCGKSHVAQALGRELGFVAFDADSLIEEDESRSIAEIFADEGEGYFRDLEAMKVTSLLNQADCVIATGGGALMRAETLELILDKAVSIWINTDVDILIERVKGDQSRPLIGAGDARKKLLLLLSERLPLYGEADIYVENNGDEADVLSEIERALVEYL